jgi:hypothetical protein
VVKTVKYDKLYSGFKEVQMVKGIVVIVLN